ncbi:MULTISPECIES: ShlB/FhaC/HecB family hemolysin secretion/activation protein [unclassified Variovorax]|uniref:ShlB/FhaC/HecB family hemolysin secretion/activation protein n=1 Tax=unclassified Variovorax TaxID=663243 RepID=UPI0034E94E09
MDRGEPWKQPVKKWHATLSLDDRGSEAAGRYPSGAAVLLDNPFDLNGLFCISANLFHRARAGRSGERARMMTSYSGNSVVRETFRSGISVSTILTQRILVRW